MHKNLDIREFSNKEYYRKTSSPVTFTQPLQNQQAEEGGSVTLSCEVSKPNASVQWKKAGTLTIHSLSEADAGEYTCDTGDQQTTAAVHLKGCSKPHPGQSQLLWTTSARASPPSQRTISF
uniref:Ig-like domain-containing protein n=1 Tax=Ficedula albicollis TaxID=59894 RepID=A0A803VBE2_FICAL